MCNACNASPNPVGIAEIGVYRQGSWIVDMDGNRQLDAHDVLFSLGDGADLPVVGDWDGDGIDDPGIFRPEAGDDGAPDG